MATKTYTADGWTYSRPALCAGMVAVEVRMSALDAAWSRDWSYIQADGQGAVEGRLEAMHAYLATGKPIEMPMISVQSSGSVGFYNGRHRTAAARAAGKTSIWVVMSKADARRWAR